MNWIFKSMAPEPKAVYAWVSPTPSSHNPYWTQKETLKRTNSYEWINLHLTLNKWCDYDDHTYSASIESHSQTRAIYSIFQPLSVCQTLSCVFSLESIFFFDFSSLRILFRYSSIRLRHSLMTNDLYRIVQFLSWVIRLFFFFFIVHVSFSSSQFA